MEDKNVEITTREQKHFQEAHLKHLEKLNHLKTEYEQKELPDLYEEEIIHFCCWHKTVKSTQLKPQKNPVKFTEEKWEDIPDAYDIDM